MVVDTYETVESDNAEPVHRAYCKVKIFRDKVGTLSVWSTIFIYVRILSTVCMECPVLSVYGVHCTECVWSALY